jgi:hypothetical protein
MTTRRQPLQIGDEQGAVGELLDLRLADRIALGIDHLHLELRILAGLLSGSACGSQCRDTERDGARRGLFRSALQHCPEGAAAIERSAPQSPAERGRR